MKARFLAGLVLLAAASLAAAQQPQTQTAPISAINAKYANGVAPGYAPAAGSGLTLNLGGGTAFCSGSVVTYAASTLTMNASTTNYVYLNTAASCVPAVKTSTFTSSDIPIAEVVASESAITGITDVRTPFIQPSSGGGGGGGVQYNSTSTVNYFYGDSRFIVDTDCNTDGSLAGSVSSYAISGGTGTFQYSAWTPLTAGQVLQFYGFTGGNTFLNGQNVTVSATGLSSSQFEGAVSGTGSATAAGSFGCTYNWPRTAAALPFFNGHGTVVAGGISDATLSTLISDYTANVHPSSPAVTGNPGYLFIQVGTTDIGGGTSAATMEADFQTLWADAHVDGWQIVQTTILPGNFGVGCGSNCVSTWLAVNVWLAEQSKGAATATGQYWDSFVDTAAVLSDNENVSSNFYRSDNVHLNNSGTAMAAAQTNAAMAAQGSNVQAFLPCSEYYYFGYACLGSGVNLFTGQQMILAPTGTINPIFDWRCTTCSSGEGDFTIAAINNAGQILPYWTLNGSNVMLLYQNAGSVAFAGYRNWIYAWNVSAPDTGLSAPNPGEVDCGNGTLGDTSCTFKAHEIDVDSCVGCSGGSGIGDIQITLPTTAIGANSCTSAATATMTGLTTTMAFSTAFATNPNGVTGWGANGGLVVTLWPTANTLNWSVCNQTGSSITPGAMTLNVGAQ